MLGPLLHVLGNIERLIRAAGAVLSLHSVNFFLEVEQLRLLPLLDLLPAQIELSTAVFDIQERRRELAGVLAGSGEDTLTGGRDGASDLVGGCCRQGKNTMDGNTHVQSQLATHEELHTAALRLHKAGSGGGGGTRHLLRGTAMGELILGIAGGLHVGKFVGAFLLEVVKSTHKADARLSFNDGLVTNVNGLDGRGAGTNGSLDWTGG